MIKMRICSDTESRCDECGKIWRNVSEMYEIKLFGKVWKLCRICSEELFRKTLKAECMHNAKVKTKEDKLRKESEERWKRNA